MRAIIGLLMWPRTWRRFVEAMAAFVEADRERQQREDEDNARTD